MKKQLIIALCAGCLLLAGPAQADELKLPPIAQQYDANGDGRLDEGEVAALKEYFRQTYDRNGDGKLDANERKAAREMILEMLAE